MRYLYFFVVVILASCGPEAPKIEWDKEMWSKRAVKGSLPDSLEHGKSYLSVYSEVYSRSQERKYALTGIISMRNVSEVDTIFFSRADYYNTEGSKIRTYFDYPIQVLPMETLEIIIDQTDIEGGTGSNFIFEWKTPSNCEEPLIEGVMLTMAGGQGISFTTQSKRIE